MKKLKQHFQQLSNIRKALFIIFSLLTLFMIWFIFSHSAKTATASSGDSAGLSHFTAVLINKLFGTSYTADDTVGYVRIFAHISEFAAFCYVFSASYESFFEKYRSPFYISIPLTFTIAFIDEVIQIFYEGRAFQVSDILCDTLGGVLGGICFYITLIIVYKKRKG